MSPFNHQENHPPKRGFSFVIFFVLAVATALFLLVPNSAEKAYSKYQDAFSAYDMNAVIDQSDERSRLFVSNLLGWVLRGEDAEIRKLRPLEQNLVWAARCQAILDQSPINSEEDLMAAWTSRLRLGYYLPQTELRNSFTSKNEAQAQIFDKRARILTEVKIYFTKEDSWKVDTIGLIQDLINQLEGDPLLTINKDFFSRGYEDEYTVPLNDWKSGFPKPPTQDS